MDEGKKTLQTIKSCDYLTLMLDESTDESNRSELSLIFRIVNNGVIEKQFLDLMQLQRCDAEVSKLTYVTVELKYNQSDSPGWMDAQPCQVNTTA